MNALGKFMIFVHKKWAVVLRTIGEWLQGHSNKKK
jgi:hypothetical protein